MTSVVGILCLIVNIQDGTVPVLPQSIEVTKDDVRNEVGRRTFRCTYAFEPVRADREAVGAMLVETMAKQGFDKAKTVDIAQDPAKKEVVDITVRYDAKASKPAKALLQSMKWSSKDNVTTVELAFANPPAVAEVDAIVPALRALEAACQNTKTEKITATLDKEGPKKEIRVLRMTVEK